MKTQHGSELTGEEMAQMLEEWANTFNSRQRIPFAEYITTRVHRTLQQKLMGVFVACIEAWASDKGGHDGRNEATVRLCQKIVAATGDQYDRHLPFI